MVVLVFYIQDDCERISCVGVYGYPVQNSLRLGALKTATCTAVVAIDKSPFYSLAFWLVI